MTIGIGIVGAGKHGERYLRHVGEVPALRLVALCRRDRARGADQARVYGCRYHADPEALVADPEVDAVVLVLPPTENQRVAVAAAGAGKALLIEKPLAPTLAACRAIAEAVQAAGTLAMVAHTLRFNVVVAALAAARATIGPLHAAVLTQRFEPSPLAWLDRPVEGGGGIILHTGVHSFDLLRYLSGREPARVTAYAARVSTRQTEDDFAAIVEMAPPTARAGALGGLATKEDDPTPSAGRADDAVPMLAMLGGSRATAGRSGAIELAGRDGQLVGDHVHGWAARLVGTRREPLAIGAAVPTVRAALEEFAAAIAGRRAPAITLADGAASVALAQACYRSIAEKRTVAVEG